VNGFEVAELVAEAITAHTSFSLEPNAVARIEPIAEPTEITDAVRTSVVWRQRQVIQETKSNRIRVHTIDIALMARTDREVAKFKPIVNLAEEIEEFLITQPITGLRRRTSLVGTETPYILQHMMDHGVATVVVTVEFEVQI
jgi:hypothetical protein